MTTTPIPKTPTRTPAGNSWTARGFLLAAINALGPYLLSTLLILAFL